MNDNAAGAPCGRLRGSHGLAAEAPAVAPAEPSFDDVARVAADLCGTEIAFVTLADADRHWFRARVGGGDCMTSQSSIVVEDTRGDPRFAENPLVTGDPHIRFYAGVPVAIEGGTAMGALAVADRVPRRLTESQLESLQRLARQVAREVHLRRDLALSGGVTPPLESLVAPGTLVGGRWRIARELGRGTVGAVFEAEDADGARAAIKVLDSKWRAQEQALERFAREARVLMHLRSPHVGRLLDVGNLDRAAGDLPYLVLELLEGEDLQRVIQRRGPVPFRQALAWCADACRGVAEAHLLGVVHRDLKPSNVFLARGAGGEPLVKVLDFGVATGDPAARGAGRLTGEFNVLGSPAYMSPEQAASPGDVDPRSDVWSLGVTLYELVTGRLPFTGSTALQIFAAVMSSPPALLRPHERDVIPPAVEAIIDRCLQKDRAQRYQSMSALEADLRAVAGR